jgi:hypothetical protein
MQERSPEYDYGKHLNSRSDIDIRGEGVRVGATSVLLNRWIPKRRTVSCLCDGRLRHSHQLRADYRLSENLSAAAHRREKPLQQASTCLAHARRIRAIEVANSVCVNRLFESRQNGGFIRMRVDQCQHQAFECAVARRQVGKQLRLRLLQLQHA